MGITKGEARAQSVAAGGHSSNKLGIAELATAPTGVDDSIQCEMKAGYSHLPRTLEAARRLGLKRFFPGEPCPNGHIAPRYVSTTNCVTCQLEHARRNGGWKARPSKEEYLEKVRRLIQRKGGILLSTAYVSAKSPLRLVCGRKHQFPVSYDNLRHGRWCPECKRLDHAERMTSNLRPVQELREFTRRKHGGDCLATKPVSVTTKVLWKCRVSDHPPFPAAPSRVMAERNGTWCPACDAERKRLHPPNPPLPRARVEQIITEKGGRILAIAGDGVWRGGRTPLRLECARGHRWTATAGNLVHRHSWCGGGCQSRFGERIARAILETTFGAAFPVTRPDWMPYGASGRHRLTLDGYNDDLKIAFEYQGPHHLTQHVVATDKKKQDACRKHGVRLIVIESVRQPFPQDRVLAQVNDALKAAGIRKRAKLPAHGLWEHELGELRRLGVQRGGQCLATTFRGWDAPYEWKCATPEHPSWLATRYQIKNVGSWCAHCAGNARLGIEGLRKWGRKHGFDLVDKRYRSASAYRWRCLKAGHSIRRSRGNIQQSLDKGYPACTKCAEPKKAIARFRAERADAFAKRMAPVIAKLRRRGLTTYDAIADRLKAMGVVTLRGARWHASTIRNLEARSAGLAKTAAYIAARSLPKAIAKRRTDRKA